MAYTLDTVFNLGSSQTGLTLRAALTDTAGALTVKDVSSGFFEVGSGVYLFHYASFPDGHRGALVVYTGSIGVGTDFSGVVVKGAVAINPEEAESVAGIRTDTEDIQSRLPAALTAAGMMKADVKYVNGVQVDGTGATGDEWGPV